jgi:predicted phosphoadenosine phosphosulfate sulfurtransferase
MSRVRHYIGKDVLTAAKERLHHIYDLYDSVVVCFSGGKDSLVALHLAKEICEERGIKKVDAIFRDEELISDTIINFVDEYRQEPWLDLKWFTTPLESHLFVMGKTRTYIQWDLAREGSWVRPKPAWGISLAPDEEQRLAGTKGWDTEKRAFVAEVGMDTFASKFYRGKIAFVTGIRAQESLIRYRASVNKLNDSYINATDCARVSLCKPIYDWQENDVFKFFHERGIKYCPWYDQQLFSGVLLRVTTPLCSEPAKHLAKNIQVEPEFYDRVLRMFPEMNAQVRYWKEFDRESVFKKYGSDGFAGIYRYIEEFIEEPAQQKMARVHVRFAETHAANGSHYKTEDVLRHIVNGQFRRTMIATPLPKGQTA